MSIIILNIPALLCRRPKIAPEQSGIYCTEQYFQVNSPSKASGLGMEVPQPQPFLAKATASHSLHHLPLSIQKPPQIPAESQVLIQKVVIGLKWREGRRETHCSITMARREETEGLLGQNTWWVKICQELKQRPAADPALSPPPQPPNPAQVMKTLDEHNTES